MFTGWWVSGLLTDSGRDRRFLCLEKKIVMGCRMLFISNS